MKLCRHIPYPFLLSITPMPQKQGHSQLKLVSTTITRCSITLGMQSDNLDAVRMHAGCAMQLRTVIVSHSLRACLRAIMPTALKLLAHCHVWSSCHNLLWSTSYGYHKAYKWHIKMGHSELCIYWQQKINFWEHCSSVKSSFKLRYKFHLSHIICLAQIHTRQ